MVADGITDDGATGCVCFIFLFVGFLILLRFSRRVLFCVCGVGGFRDLLWALLCVIRLYALLASVRPCVRPCVRDYRAVPVRRTSMFHLYVLSLHVPNVLDVMFLILFFSC